MRIIAIIPARGGSKRLPKKNIYPLDGKPLLQYTVDACRTSAYIKEIFLSSDDDEILSVGNQLGIVPLRRPATLADDKTPKILAIRQAAMDSVVGPMQADDIVVIPQANSPQISPEQLDRGCRLMLDYNLWEVMSTDDNGVQNAAFRIVRFHALFNEFLSAHCGFVVANNVDVHTIEDINKLEQK
jgi:CMP-N,N'-diacetyllegionaminic acid synthase